MKISTNFLKGYVLPILVLTTLSGCLYKTAAKNMMDNAYTEAIISTKVDALLLMDKAVDDINNYEDEVEALIADFRKAYEYQKIRKKSHSGLKTYELMLNENKPLLMGFIKNWKRGTIIDEEIKLAKQRVEEGFDVLIMFTYRRVSETDIAAGIRFIKKYE